MQQVVPETGQPVCGGLQRWKRFHRFCLRMRQSGPICEGAEVVALHVHHGLSAHADAWLQHARTQCEAWAAQGLPVRLCADKLALQNVPVGDSLEAVARRPAMKHWLAWREGRGLTW